MSEESTAPSEREHNPQAEASEALTESSAAQQPGRWSFRFGLLSFLCGLGLPVACAISGAIYYFYLAGQIPEGQAGLSGIILIAMAGGAAIIGLIAAGFPLLLSTLLAARHLYVGGRFRAASITMIVLSLVGLGAAIVAATLLLVGYLSSTSGPSKGPADLSPASPTTQAPAEFTPEPAPPPTPTLAEAQATPAKVAQPAKPALLPDSDALEATSTGGAIESATTTETPPPDATTDMGEVESPSKIEESSDVEN